MNRILRLKDVIARIGRARSTLYMDIADGVMVTPVKIGRRSVGFLESEVESLIAARVAGADEKEIQRLVIDLQKARKVFLKSTPALEGR